MLLASANEHKAAEFRRIFTPHTILLPVDVGVEFRYEEGGESYLANALGKARALYEESGRPVIADDSGLAVTALGGAPGVFSSRFGSEEAGRILSSQERNRILLDRLEGEERREASFICCMVLVIDRRRFFAVQEILEGEIADRPHGGGGFGYDPIFTVAEEGRTVAELTDERKDGLSHRGRAGRRLLAMMEGLP